STHSSSINICPLRYFEDVTATVSELRDKVQDILRDTWCLTGRCYREVERRRGGADVAVSHKNICRAGDSDTCLFGYNNKSWSLDCYVNCYTFYHSTTFLL
ncbi:hypothetical protein ILYODFUR_037285, partial [Ilyodon furcidens]